jgi:SAM-dependent methyltransferase
MFRDRVSRNGDIRRAAPRRFLRAAYQIMLRRDPDPNGLQTYLDVLADGTYTPDRVLDDMLTSMELRQGVPYRDRNRSMHQSRCDFVRLLPRARRILDLGGTDQSNPVGALVSMGYPYAFDNLTIVDLPHGERHGLYSGSAVVEEVQSPLGPVQYRYHSMTDLSAYDDASFDMVFSGQTIEHVSEDDARAVLREVLRVLTPGGYFCVDTPNRAATVVELGDIFTNPDHKIEYTHPQFAAMLEEAGFEIDGAYGLNYVGESLATGRFSTEELARNHGLYAEIEACYLLAYVSRAPMRTS